MASLDPRLIKLTLTIDGTDYTYENYKVHAKGTKVSAAMSSQCDISIQGISAETRNFILQSTNPGRTGTRKSVKVKLEVGRESYGAALYYRGDVYRSFPIGRPDMGVTLKCLVGYGNKSVIVQRGGSEELTLLSQIATWVASDNGYQLSFEVTDRYIKSYSFTGSAMDSITKLEDLCDCDVYIDNGTLYIKESTESASGTTKYKVNNDNANLLSAMATESGVSVSMMFHPAVTIGSEIALESDLNPSINGSYVIYKADFDVEKRGTNFYLNVEAL